MAVGFSALLACVVLVFFVSFSTRIGEKGAIDADADAVFDLQSTSTGTLRFFVVNNSGLLRQFCASAFCFCLSFERKTKTKHTFTHSNRVSLRSDRQRVQPPTLRRVHGRQQQMRYLRCGLPPSNNIHMLRCAMPVVSWFVVFIFCHFTPAFSILTDFFFLICFVLFLFFQRATRTACVTATPPPKLTPLQIRTTGALLLRAFSFVFLCSCFR